MLSCNNCNRNNGFLLASGHGCEVCGHTTYSAMKLCDACAFILDQCEFCRAALNLNLDAALLQPARDAAEKHRAELAAFTAEYDQAVAPIAAAIARFRSAQEAINAEQKVAFDQHMHYIESGGGSRLVEKSPADGIAYTASQKKTQTDYQAAEAALGSDRLLWNYATEKRSIETMRADGIFNQQIKTLVAIAQLPRTTKQELDRIEEHYKLSIARLVDPRLAQATEPAEIKQVATEDTTVQAT